MKRSAGFTLIELMAVVAVIAILALMALPSQLERIAQQQVAEALELAKVVTEPVATHWRVTGKLEGDNAALMLPEPAKIVNSRVQSVSYDNGAVHLRFGNQVSSALQGKTLTVRAAVVEGEARVPVTWLCHKAAVPQGMTPQGLDKTDIEARYLPLRCR